MMNKPKCVLTIDTEAIMLNVSEQHANTLIYGQDNGLGISHIMDIADSHNVQMTFFLDFAEVELYGDEIIQVGKYIISRGHDLQILCRHELLSHKVLNRFPNASQNYCEWYEDEEISAFIIDYCLEQYHKCTANSPRVFRGYEYQFGKALIKKLKEKGFSADASYNFMYPRQLPVNLQFIFENGLMELPVGILPDHKNTQDLHFNDYYLPPPVCLPDLNQWLQTQGDWFHEFYEYYGDNAFATLVMHSNSFCNVSNPCTADFFDSLLNHFSHQIDFITASKATQMNKKYFIKTADFDSIFSHKACTPSQKIDEYICPICGGNEFEVYNSPMPRRCVKCGSSERNRTISKLFSESLGMDLLSKKILHISPSNSERLYFKHVNAQNITTIDIRPQVKPDIVADICNMPQIESNSFDIVFANCVLNCVYDDDAALSEIRRVLRNEGLFITYVMGNGKMKSLTTAKTIHCTNPTEWYGQEAMDNYKVGTYRYYGELDFVAQLQHHFPKISYFEKYDELSELSCCWYVCKKESLSSENNNYRIHNFLRCLNKKLNQFLGKNNL